MSSELKRGSVFRIILDGYKNDSKDVEQSFTETSSSTAITAAASSIHVQLEPSKVFKYALVAEDSSPNRSLIVTLLEKYFEVVIQVIVLTIYVIISLLYDALLL